MLAMLPWTMRPRWLAGNQTALLKEKDSELVTVMNEQIKKAIRTRAHKARSNEEVVEAIFGAFRDYRIDVKHISLDEMKSQPDPIAASRRFFQLFGDHLRSRTTAEWTEIFAEADVPCSAVMSTAEHLDDEQVVHNRMYRIVPDPTLGQVRRARHPALFGGEPVDTDDLPCPPLSSGGAASRPT